MNNSWHIASREFRERIGSRSYVLFSIFGPLVLLGFVYLLFLAGDVPEQRWKVLISDKAGIMENKIFTSGDKAVTYSFVDDYVDHDEFADAKKFQEFDALLEINEKILSNKIAFVFYREEPSTSMQMRVRYHCERRLEEVIAQELYDMPVQKYRKIKTPIGFSFRDVYDPYGMAADLKGWAGFFFGALIFVFIFLFGMTILRSVVREKSNRIVEVLLASVSPNQLMTGKIIGIGMSAFLQFTIWITIVSSGLYLMRETVFPDVRDASNVEMMITEDDASQQEQFFGSMEYNEFVDLVYERMQFSNTLGFFFVFFIAGYLFYGAFFAAIGSTMGSESDGQQFVIPIILLLCFALYSGYYALHYPDAPLSKWLHYLPFTSPVVVMVKLAQGYEPGHAYELYVALLILLAGAFAMLGIAGRLYKNGILQFGHRLQLRHLIKWLRRS